MIRLIVLITAIVVSSHMKAQTLVFEHLYKNEMFYLETGSTFYIQTLDDPIGFSTKVRLIKFNQDTFYYSKSRSKKEVFKVPRKDIACMYIFDIKRALLKTVLIGAGLSLSISGLSYFTDEPSILALNAVGIPLCVVGFQFSSYKRYYLPYFDIYLR